MIKLHYDWQYEYLRPSEKEIIDRYNAKWHGDLVPAAPAPAAAPAAATAPAPALVHQHLPPRRWPRPRQFSH